MSEIILIENQSEILKQPLLVFLPILAETARTVDNRNTDYGDQRPARYACGTYVWKTH